MRFRWIRGTKDWRGSQPRRDTGGVASNRTAHLSQDTWQIRAIAPTGQEGWTRLQENVAKLPISGADGVVVLDRRIPPVVEPDPPPRLRLRRSHPSWPGGEMALIRHICALNFESSQMIGRGAGWEIHSSLRSIPSQASTPGSSRRGLPAKLRRKRA